MALSKSPAHPELVEGCEGEIPLILTPALVMEVPPLEWFDKLTTSGHGVVEVSRSP